jgi:hypothetical protein
MTEVEVTPLSKRIFLGQLAVETKERVFLGDDDLDGLRMYRFVAQ